MSPQNSKTSIKTEKQQLHWGKEHSEKWNFSYDSCGSLTKEWCYNHWCCHITK